MEQVNDLAKKSNNAIARAENIFKTEIASIHSRLQSDILALLELDCNNLETRLYATEGPAIRGRIQRDFDKAVIKMHQFKRGMREGMAH